MCTVRFVNTTGLMLSVMRKSDKDASVEWHRTSRRYAECQCGTEDLDDENRDRVSYGQRRVGEYLVYQEREHRRLLTFTDFSFLAHSLVCCLLITPYP